MSTLNNPKVKICFDARMINHSGIGTYINNYSKKLIQNDNFQVILLGSPDLISRILGQDLFNRAQIIDFNAPIYSIKEQLKFPFVIPSCDIFISPHFNVPLLPINARKRVSFIADAFFFKHSFFFSKFQQLYIWLLTQCALKLSDKTITISEFSKSELLKYTKTNKDIKVIHLGIDNAYFSKIQDINALDEARKKYKLPSKFILFVGNVKPHKNLTRLLHALESEICKNEAVKLVIVGKKDGYITGDPEIFKLFESSQYLQDNVIFTGYVEAEDLPKIYNLAVFFVFPSLYEGFGFPPLEAMACGCPTLVSNAASIPEVCGNASLYMDATIPENIAKGIIELLSNENLRSSLITKGWEQIKHFTWENSTNQLINEIESI